MTKKLKRKLKKRLSYSMSSIILILAVIVGSNMANFTATIKQFAIDTMTTDEASEVSAYSTRLSNTDTITYIYDIADLVAFRDAVNAGDTYEGKTIYLMADIDLSSVCSSTLGSWEPIAMSSNNFAGTFDGNYHTISNLYMNTNTYQRSGLFSRNTSTAIIRNLIMENVYIYNNYDSANSYAGAVIALNYGTIMNCATISGSVTTAQTSVGSSSGWRLTYSGGIVGLSSTGGIIESCYNKATVKGSSKTTSGYGQSRVGGICGAVNNTTIKNCYNGGSVSSIGYYTSVGGCAGVLAGNNGVMQNCYNYGSVTMTSNSSSKYIGGVLGRNGEGSGSTATKGTVSNVHCTTGTSYTYYNMVSSSSYSTVTTNRVAAATLKTKVVTLGSAFAYDVYNKNSGYPVLAWENDKTVMSLNKNQAYIGVGEELTLKIIENSKVTEIIGNNYSASNFTWTSTNEDVATVNENGIVTGISDGYTTVYAYHEASGMYAMAVINVAKEVANPQIGTGKGFTVILKADGTVWTLGNNENGQLGNGTNENSNIPVSVKMDEDTNLNNIVKIAVATDHVLALTKDGYVYAWGLNSIGQLGQNNTENANYAKLVLGEDGASHLSNIVDISAGAYGSIALDKNGNVYVWGEGSYGEIGNNATNSSSLPIKTTMENAIQISIGQRFVSALTSEGVVWAWGLNSSGELGINCTNNTSYPMKTALNVTEISNGAYHTVVKKIDGTVYACRSIYFGKISYWKYSK